MFFFELSCTVAEAQGFPYEGHAGQESGMASPAGKDDAGSLGAL